MKLNICIISILLLFVFMSCRSIGKFYVDTESTCGNGVLDPGETCDPPSTCPVTCADSDPCTLDTLTGSPETCNAGCMFQVITVCSAGDGCCPDGCDPGSDSDCSKTCGNGTIDEGETCDPPETCPTSCDDGNACTEDVLTGSASNCSARCSHLPINTCVGGDGCCPAACDPSTDSDCSSSCGDGVIDAGETCDPPETCPTSCSDGNVCTSDILTGSASNCNASCSYRPITSCTGGDGCCPAGCDSINDSDCSTSCGNGTIETGETCDPPATCPTSCDDDDACTSDSMTGSAANCNVACSHNAVTSCTGGDGCCPSTCNSSTDSDCSALCGNGVIDDGETCDPVATCPTSCNDGDPCTSDALAGNPDNCNASCPYPPITSCTGGDGCCPSSCDSTNDSDCTSTCGNSVIETGETCDPPATCPTTCDDGDPCTSDALSGSPDTCDAQCPYSTITSCTGGDGCCPSSCNSTNDSDCDPFCGNSVIESGETCDPPSSCPSDCNDGNPCTSDFMYGSPSTCDVDCDHAAISTCTNDDGCCPTSCDSTNDNDCSFDCRDDATWPDNWAAFEAEVVTLMNAERAAGAVCNGVSMPPVPPLTHDPAAREASRCHSLDMATNDFFSHTGSDGSQFWERMSTAGYTASAVGENIAGGQSTPAGAVSSWMSSTAGHCEMIMSASANEVGIGYVYDSSARWRHYWTADFGHR